MQSGYTGIERRKHKRISKNFLTKFKISEPDHSESSGSWNMVSLINLGAGGLSFTFDRDIPVGKDLDISVNFPFTRGAIRCMGTVLRSDAQSPVSLRKVAAQFTRISDIDRKIIDVAADEYTRPRQ